ncbi:MAG TPA: zf-HC2 domain-containing protein [Longimicrobium sp.]|nr:zf-HC2 domain-containing protein [Longimicrobium sp.]
MTHEHALERLDDFACGELPDIERVRVQRHVEGCAECQAEVREIQSLLAEAAALPRGIAPPRDLWAGIAARLEAPATPVLVAEEPAEAVEETKVIPFAPVRRGWRPPTWALQIAAALVLVVGSSAITSRIVRQQQPQPGGPVALTPVSVNPAAGGPAVQGAADPAAARPVSTTTPAPVAGRGGTAQTAFAAFRPAERSYQTAIADLQQALETKRGEMAPETVETLERNLRIIDAAIAESRAALEKDPNSRELTQMLGATYDAKVKVLRRAVEI